MLAGWVNYYVILGSSAAALIGLQFVVIALIAQTRVPSSLAGIRAFGTPTVVHLGGALVISATMTAPWPALWGARIALAACAIAGTAISATVVHHARRNSGYTPVLEDWIWHVVLPAGAYVALLLAAIGLDAHLQGSGFTVAAAALTLLLIAIHNAWDTVTYIVARQLERGEAGPGTGSS
jgi:hypothetical protein